MSDLELREWRAAWRDAAPEAPPIPDDLRRIVRRGDRRLVLVTLGEVLLTVASIAVAIVFVRAEPNAPRIVWAAAVFALFAATWTFAIVNRRGTWRANGESVRSFVELARERCERKLRALRFVVALLAVEVLFLAGWGAWEHHATPPANSAELAHRSLRWAIVSLTVVCFAAWTLVARRAALREREAIDAVVESLETP